MSNDNTNRLKDKLKNRERCESCEQILSDCEGGPIESLREWYESGNHVCEKGVRTKQSFLAKANEIGMLVEAKNAAYGSSFEKCGEFLRLLYPNGMKPEQYQDALLLVRIFDKQMRIATHKDALGENPYRDIAGYGILGATEER
jgi:hypothetical protein